MNLKPTLMGLVCALALPCYVLADTNSELFTALRAHNIDAVKAAVASGANVNGLDENGNTPLCNATFWADQTQFLLDNKADVNGKGSSGLTALMNACSFGETEVVKVLLAAKADVNVTNGIGQTPLALAASSGTQASIVKMLLDAGAAVDAKDKFGRTALFALCAYGKSPAERITVINSQVPFLQKYGVTFPEKYTNPKESDHSAVGEIAKILLDAKADVSVSDAAGLTALMWAAKYNRADAVKALTAAGADINAKSKTGYTALVYASEKIETADAGKALLEAGADPNVLVFYKFLDGEFNNVSPLIIASRSGNMEMAKALVAAKADVNIICHAGKIENKRTGYVKRTAASIAHFYNHEDISNMLIAAGAKSIENIEKAQ